MNRKTRTIVTIALLLVCSTVVQARIKLVALPERGDTIIRLDNPQWTLIEEERVLTLQEGLNKVDFSWKGVSIDMDSIRLAPLDHKDDKEVRLLNVSYPPNEAALVWEIASTGNYAEKVRISYLLRNIDRLVTYKAIADKSKTYFPKLQIFRIPIIENQTQFVFALCVNSNSIGFDEKVLNLIHLIFLRP